MSENSEHRLGGKIYYMYGSGLIPVPHTRLNDFARLKSEYHAGEVRMGLMIALARKPA
jgi:hypothetical protein